MKIAYLCPVAKQPSGGVRRLFRHVQYLCEAGFDAYIALPKDAKGMDWMETKVPTIYSDVFDFAPQDAVVIPDSFLSVIEPIKDLPVRKVVICLGFVSPFYRLPAGVSWKDYNIEEVLVNNPEIGSFLNFSDIWPGKYHIVETGIDKYLYYPEKKKFQVAYLTKQHDRQFEMLEKILYLRAMNRGREFIKFVELKGLSEEEYAQVLRESAIFACDMYCEGFSVPILEAMASGCLCCGSHGVGGSKFVFNDLNFLEVPPGDIYAFAKTLRNAVNMIEDKSWQKFGYLQIIQQAIIEAAFYTYEKEKKNIVDFWKVFCNEKNS